MKKILLLSHLKKDKKDANHSLSSSGGTGHGHHNTSKKPAMPPKTYDHFANVMVLGYHESGKTTLQRQLDLLYGLEPLDPKYYQRLIYANTLATLIRLIENSENLNVSIHNDNLERVKRVMGTPIELARNRLPRFPLKLSYDCKCLWEDKGIQTTFTHSKFCSEYRTPGRAKYYMENMFRVFSPEFVPNEIDIISAYDQVDQIQTSTLLYKRFKMDLICCSGKLSQPKEYSNLLQYQPNYIFYVVSLKDYFSNNTVIPDSTSIPICNNHTHKNLLVEALNNFELFVKSDLLDQANQVYLIFNTCDIFYENIKQFDLKHCFPDYQGGCDPTQAIEFISNKFSQFLVEKEKAFKTHVINLLDKNHVREQFDILLDSLIPDAEMRGLTFEMALSGSTNSTISGVDTTPTSGSPLSGSTNSSVGSYPSHPSSRMPHQSSILVTPLHDHLELNLNNSQMDSSSLPSSASSSMSSLSNCLVSNSTTTTTTTTTANNINNNNNNNINNNNNNNNNNISKSKSTTQPAKAQTKAIDKENKAKEKELKAKEKENKIKEKELLKLKEKEIKEKEKEEKERERAEKEREKAEKEIEKQKAAAAAPPVVKKKKGKGLSVQSGYYAMQGRRKNMEDTHAVYDDLLTETNYSANRDNIDGLCAYYAVYDGHGGADTSKALEPIVHKCVVDSTSFQSGNFEQSLRDGYEAADKKVIPVCEKSGSTGVSVMLVGNTLYAANIGDSEAVLARNVGNAKSPQYEHTLLTYKHLANDDKEKVRITELGGMIIFGRLFGSLAVSRSFGDKEYKEGEKKFVVCEPYQMTLDLTPNDHFLILACDGLWDKVTYEEAVQITTKQLKLGKTPTEISTTLAQESYEKGSVDNISVVVILLNWK
ncbi:hypothetical protein CYY_003095 [Polysphondylium violaceum]|uniref:PPM-type phosphatase domain-containing protein n=1 Tax=Polysphondylium violaceum TaxID=133409 RepID=A0A8J4PY80_9MYCE|nr:hypothetical protein CYY_003095 [Polysphondylium violaceum]